MHFFSLVRTGTKYVQKAHPICFRGWGGVFGVAFSFFGSPCVASPDPSRTDYAPPNHSSFEREYRPKRRAKAMGELKAHETATALQEPVSTLSRLGVLASLYCVWLLLAARLGFLCVYFATFGGFALLLAT